MQLLTIARHFSTHAFALGVGFILGIYLLPILIEPDAPDTKAITAVAAQSTYSAVFSRDRIGSDQLHWGEGTVSISEQGIAFAGELAPGPDYKLYLSPVVVETEEDFKSNKASMVRIADVKTFSGFLADIPGSVNIHEYNTVVVWCETFSQYISSGQYR